MRLRFLGAAGEVTGSCYLVEAKGLRFLVDCGMFQGGRDALGKNLAALDFDLRQLDFVLLTHAHLDHSGLLPRLVSLGYRGPIFTTGATVDLLGVMLLDSAHIQEKEAEWETRRRHGRHASRGRQHAVLYTVSQAQACLHQLRGVEYGQDVLPHARVRCRFLDAGHILGSAIIEVWVEEAGAELRRFLSINVPADLSFRSPAALRPPLHGSPCAGGRALQGNENPAPSVPFISDNRLKLVFSGDLGQPGRPVLLDPAEIAEADVLVMESTYGDRLHRTLVQTEDELVEALKSTLPSGNVIIPAFSVGRTQELLFVLTDLIKRQRLDPVDIYVDSPMALAATRLTLKHEALLDEETRSLILWQQAHPRGPRIRFVQDVEESIALNNIRSGAVIISASGMCDAGRIKYHLQNNLSRSECAVLITGFQAVGTLGRRLVDGARRVRIFGESLPVRARILTIGGLSAHADQEALLGWLSHFRRPPGQTFIVHGEPNASRILAERIGERYHWADINVPQQGQAQELRQSKPIEVRQ